MSQGDRPAVDFSRHDLYTWGRTWPVQHIVPVYGPGHCVKSPARRRGGVERTNCAQHIFCSVVDGHSHAVLVDLVGVGRLRSNASRARKWGEGGWTAPYGLK